MQSRASEIGAKLGIDSAPASGTVVRVELPLGGVDAQT
jgi:signal transduction histidine kinase